MSIDDDANVLHAAFMRFVYCLSNAGIAYIQQINYEPSRLDIMGRGLLLTQCTEGATNDELGGGHDGEHV